MPSPWRRPKPCGWQRLRAHLRSAGVSRPQLFQRTASRQPIRLHDLRATFVTLSLAAGRSETWVADRTGHRSSAMIHRYRRAARSVAQLDLGALGSVALR
jgi:integrase